MTSETLNLPGNKTASEFLLLRPGETPVSTVLSATWFVEEPDKSGHRQLSYEIKLSRDPKHGLIASNIYRTVGDIPHIDTDTPTDEFAYMAIRFHEPSAQTLANITGENVIHYANAMPHDLQQISWLKQHGYKSEFANPTTFERTYTPHPKTERQ